MAFNGMYANRHWFTCGIDAGGGEPENLDVYAFHGREQVSDGYIFNIEAVTRRANVDIPRLLGCPCHLDITDKSGGTRHLHGLVRQMKQMHTANSVTHYLLEVTPRLYFLKKTQDHRIYQHMTVPDIIQQVLNKHGFPEEAYIFQLRDKYPKREYCTQYGESDYHFICRLAEEEGIYFFHEHRQDAHILHFCDSEGGLPIPGESRLRFYSGSGQPADTAVIARLELNHRISSDSATLRDWNFTTPSADLTSHEADTSTPPAQARPLETYQFPHLYQARREGEHYAAVQILRQTGRSHWVECRSDASRHTPGYVFELYGHHRQDVNRSWWITEVRHEGRQPAVLGNEAPEERGLEYAAWLRAIPSETRFVPEQRHRKVRIEGVQSAIVTGLGGEEVHCDAYGRVKVRFHWDRTGPNDERSSCWVRVSSGLAGEGFGAIQLPRIGQEVLVEFMEGDPDRPIITGRVYNAAHMPPWHLPEQKHLSGLQSKEFHGGQRNQLVLDDTQGQVQAQLSSDHGLSQLNLGYITRLRHDKGREDFRGKGFELRTDEWGAIRSGKGLLLSTDARNKAAGKQRDLVEADRVLQAAVRQHAEQARIAVARNAQDAQDAASPTEALERQQREIAGSAAEGELSAPHLVLSSPAGIALSTSQALHLAASEQVAVSAGSDASLATSRSFFVTALKKISLFARNMGIKIFSAKGKVEIQAQSDDLDIIADKVLRLISANKNIEVGAQGELLLHAGGSYIRLDQSGVTIGCAGPLRLRTADQVQTGPHTLFKPFVRELQEWPGGIVRLDHRYHDNDPIQNAPFEALLSDGTIRKGVLDKQGKAELHDVPPGPVRVTFGPDARPYTAVPGPRNPLYKGTLSAAEREELIARHLASRGSQGGERNVR